MKVDMTKTYTAEADLLKAVKLWITPLEREGVIAMPIRDSYTIGYSDLFICARGVFVVAELKDDTGEATPHQKKFINRVNRAGGMGAVCRTVQDVADLVEEALKWSDKLEGE